MFIISEAGDTTATTIKAVVYNLLKHSSAQAQLVQELQDAQLSRPPSLAEVNKLLYLHSVMKESIRVFRTQIWSMERKVPSDSVEITGTLFPEGISTR